MSGFSWWRWPLTSAREQADHSNDNFLHWTSGEGDYVVSAWAPAEPQEVEERQWGGTGPFPVDLPESRRSRAGVRFTPRHFQLQTCRLVLDGEAAWEEWKFSWTEDSTEAGKVQHKCGMKLASVAQLHPLRHRWTSRFGQMPQGLRKLPFRWRCSAAERKRRHRCRAGNSSDCKNRFRTCFQQSKNIFKSDWCSRSTRELWRTPRGFPWLSFHKALDEEGFKSAGSKVAKILPFIGLNVGN